MLVLPGLGISVGHFARNLPAHVPAIKADMVASMFRMIFGTRRRGGARDLGGVRRSPRRVASKTWSSADGRRQGRSIGVHRISQGAHWQKIWSTNPLSINKEIKRRSCVVGIFPNLP